MPPRHHAPHGARTQPAQERFADQQQHLRRPPLEPGEARRKKRPLPGTGHTDLPRAQPRHKVALVKAVAGIGPGQPAFLLAHPRYRSRASSESRPRKSCQLCRVYRVRSPQNCSRMSAVTGCHCLVHGARVVMGVSLLQWNGFAFDSNPAYTLRLLHREDDITAISCEI